MQKTVQIKKYTASRMTDYQNLKAVIHLYGDSTAIGRLEFFGRTCRR